MPSGQFSHFLDKMSLAQDTGHRGSIPGRSGHSGTVGKPSTLYHFNRCLVAFEINVLRSGQLSGQKSGSSYKSLTLLHF